MLIPFLFTIFLLFFHSVFPEYYEVIKKPMDLSSMKENINKYETVEEVLSDLRQIWENCRLFNAEGSDISATANMMDMELEGLVEVRASLHFNFVLSVSRIFINNFMILFFILIISYLIDKFLLPCFTYCNNHENCCISCFYNFIYNCLYV